jgi:daunorubicin resistance ABC transporter ATP-binding subunit
VADPISPDYRHAIAASGVVKTFGEVTALAGLDLTVSTGTLAALLGPNGAGKTTLVRIIATLTRPDAGHVRVLGLDVVARAAQVRAHIGLTGQYAGLDEAMTGLDNLMLIGRLAGLRHRQAAHRAGELAEMFGLTAAVGRLVRTYSGGMRRRLDLAASLMIRPAVLILDEPTAGLDPASRQQLWAVLARLRADGTTMLLTTQYLEEADRFADVVHVLDRGAIVASGTAAELKDRVAGGVVEIRLHDQQALPAAARILADRLSLATGAVRAEPATGRLTLAAAGGDACSLVAAAAALQTAGIAIADIGQRRPSLDEVFLALTGSAVPA